VRQGQIGEIVNAKPSERRRILEDAAGVAGLHSRRHEAELRLKAAEANLLRVKDVLGQLASQVESLKRQARAARRYKELSAEIRQTEAVQLHLAWRAIEAEVAAEETGLASCLEAQATAVAAESRATRLEAEIAAGLQPLREEEATRGAVLQRLKIEEERLAAEEQAAVRRAADLRARIEQLQLDIERERGLLAEAREAAAAVAAECRELADSEAAAIAERAEAGAALTSQEAALRALEADVAAIHAEAADQRSARRQLEGTVREATQRLDRLTAEAHQITGEITRLEGSSSDHAKLEALRATLGDAASQAETAEHATLAAEQAVAEAATLLHSAEDARRRAELAASRLATEASTLRKLLAVPAGAAHAAVVDAMRVEAGFETALGAALGDDLVAPLDEDAPVHWRRLDDLEAAPTLPASVMPLLEKVAAPPQLRRRLAQIGIVARSDGARLQPQLAVGQRLVSVEGDLWRWDGFTAAADAPTAAAQRLTERNRLASLEVEEERTAEVAARDAARAAEAKAAHDEALARERAARDERRARQTLLATTRNELASLEATTRRTQERLAALKEGQSRTQAAIDEITQQAAVATAALTRLPAAEGIEARVRAADERLQACRRALTDAQARAVAAESAARMRKARGVELERDAQRWSARSAAAAAQLEALERRLVEVSGELTEVDALPGATAARRQAILDELGRAEGQRRDAADRLAEAETRLRAVKQQLGEAREQVASAREAKARVEARLEAARSTRMRQAQAIAEVLNCAPEGCLAAAGVAEGGPLPTLADAERLLQRLRADRERLGGVNLSADDELAVLAGQHGDLDKERTDLEEAIAKLRGGIGALNREGRKRLLDAFEQVNTHFRHLFGVLFSGGEARLELVESEDPLESGLEIIARPPGKKPNVLSLLSGGEQTLTALSLIFAVFLTNPSPICVLDEVDAPLDDANVDRFCSMMERMARDTATRFLIITHHPMTMARMDRLFGVTMAERGVSQLVSVDLSTAERMVEPSSSAA
jgi:chromosome segregation protein